MALLRRSCTGLAAQAHSSSSLRNIFLVRQVTSVSLLPAKRVSSRHHTNRAILNELKSNRHTDLDHLNNLKALSWLSPAELTLLASALTLTNFKRRAVILQEVALASEAHILLTGIARITCMNARNERVTVALIAPGLIPELPALPMSRSGFQCEAYNDCRVGTLSLDKFDSITEKSAESAFRHLHENDLKQWYRLLLRSSTFMNLGLHERIAITLLELCSDFGIEESRGTLLRVSFSQKDIAQLGRSLAAPSDRTSGAARARSFPGSSGTATHCAGGQAPGVDWDACQISQPVTLARALFRMG